VNSADDDKYLSMPTSAELGEIKLMIFEAVILGTGTKSFKRRQILPEPDKVHERSKKAIGHRFR
jgi:hypothetical protein